SYDVMSIQDLTPQQVSPTAPLPTLLFFSKTPQPPRSTLFPYTTLFRSLPATRCKAPPRRRAPHLKAAQRSGPGHDGARRTAEPRSEEHTSELQSLRHLVCRLLLEKKKHNP